MPKDGPIAKGLRKELARLMKLHGSEGMLPLYEENGVYNFYLRMPKIKDIGMLGSSSAGGDAAVSINRRRAPQL
jgi:hypothetical protein